MTPLVWCFSELNKSRSLTLKSLRRIPHIDDIYNLNNRTYATVEKNTCNIKWYSQPYFTPIQIQFKNTIIHQSWGKYSSMFKDTELDLNYRKKSPRISEKREMQKMQFSKNGVSGISPYKYSTCFQNENWKQVFILYTSIVSYSGKSYFKAGFFASYFSH